MRRNIAQQAASYFPRYSYEGRGSYRKRESFSCILLSLIIAIDTVLLPHFRVLFFAKNCNSCWIREIKLNFCTSCKFALQQRCNLSVWNSSMRQRELNFANNAESLLNLHRMPICRFVSQQLTACVRRLTRKHFSAHRCARCSYHFGTACRCVLLVADEPQDEHFVENRSHCQLVSTVQHAICIGFASMQMSFYVCAECRANSFTVIFLNANT